MVTRVGLMGRDEESRVERNAINGIPHSIFPHRLGEAPSSGEKKKKEEEKNVRKNSPCEKNFARLVRPLSANLRDDDGKVGGERKEERKEEEASAKKKREEKCNRSEHEAGNPKNPTFVFLRPASPSSIFGHNFASGHPARNSTNSFPPYYVVILVQNKSGACLPTVNNFI